MKESTVMRLRALLAKHGKGMAFERFIKHALFSGPEQEDTVISVKQLHLQLSRFMTATVPRTSVSHETNEKDIANLTRALDAAKWTPEELWEAVSVSSAGLAQAVVLGRAELLREPPDDHRIRQHPLHHLLAAPPYLTLNGVIALPS